MVVTVSLCPLSHANAQTVETTEVERAAVIYRLEECIITAWMLFVLLIRLLKAEPEEGKCAVSSASFNIPSSFLFPSFQQFECYCCQGY